MNANRRRGEIAAELDGKPYRLCLTLGALAELETAYAADDLAALVQRFSTGRLSAVDMTRLIGAGLRGAGNDVADEDVGRMQAVGGAAGFAAIVTDLLTITFSAGQTTKPLDAAAGKTGEFPWDSLLAAAFGLLRLSPRNVWSMTPREIERALSVLRGQATHAPGRGELAALMRQFPDQGRDRHG